MIITSDHRKQWAITQFVYEQALSEFRSHISDKGIDFLTIKGAYILDSGLAEQLEFRLMDDIDIVVRQDDYEKLINILINNKLYAINSQDYTYQFKKVLTYSSSHGSISIEIHCQLSHCERFLLASRDLFARSVLLNNNQRVLCPEDALIIHICHILVHIGFTIREGVLYEAGLLSRQRDFSWKTFWDIAQTTGVRSFCEMVLLWAQRELLVHVEFVHKPGLYTNFIAKFITSKRYGMLPHILRRLILELPFVRKPFSLIWQGIKD